MTSGESGFEWTARSASRLRRHDEITGCPATTPAARGKSTSKIRHTSCELNGHSAITAVAGHGFAALRVADGAWRSFTSVLNSRAGSVADSLTVPSEFQLITGPSTAHKPCERNLAGHSICPCRCLQDPRACIGKHTFDFAEKPKGGSRAPGLAGCVNGRNIDWMSSPVQQRAVNKQAGLSWPSSARSTHA